VLDAGKIDDAYYGIPMHTMQPKLMFYNTAVLDDVGVSIPTTRQEDIAAGTGQGWRHPAIAEAVNMIRDLVERGAFGTNYASVQYEAGGAETLLEQGQAAISPGARSR
jgi:ABC-type glycerol-3-phosphate transport system substrate-binding protein